MKKPYRQGDILIVPVNEIPTITKNVPLEHGKLILAHGEVTGHHHAIAKTDGVQLVTSEQADDLRMWLTVETDEPVLLTHQEHATIPIDPGLYEVRRQREYAPEALRFVQD